MCVFPNHFGSATPKFGIRNTFHCSVNISEHTLVEKVNNANHYEHPPPPP